MKGYAKIAALMGKYPESAIVRQFSDLNIQNILYLQAELVGLEQDFRKLEAHNDAPSDSERRYFSLDWYTLATTKEGEEDNKQWRLAIAISEKLREYNKAVLRYSQLISLQQPDARELSNLQEWIRRPEMGNVYLIGRDRHVWENGHDLMALRTRAHHYPLVGWLKQALPGFHYLIGKRYKQPDPAIAEFAPNTISYSDSRIVRSASLVGAIVASLLPILAIVVLYLVTSMSKRLGLIAVFTAIFSTCLWFMADGRLIEVFSATAA